MRVTREQVAAAFVLLGIEFQDAEIDMMLRRVSDALTSYEALRKTDVPYDAEPAFTFHPGLPGRVPDKGPARYQTTIPLTSTAKAPKNPEDLAFLPVTRLAPLVRSRAVTSTDLTKMYLARMKKYSPNLLCLVTLTEDLALERAAAADKEIRAGHYRGPLHGIPFGVKDLFDTKDILTAWGAEPFRSRVPARDATVVDRLNKAGAVLMAKLSMGALAMGDLWYEGQTKSPWSWSETSKSYARGSSGSSAGSASATAAGLVGFALGTETLGSIVSPSTQCGTAALRPTYGRVSRYGAMALSWTMDKIGPLCRGIEDCALVLNAIHGPDGHDRSVAAEPFHWEPRRPLAAMKIGEFCKKPSMPCATPRSRLMPRLLRTSRRPARSFPRWISTKTCRPFASFSKPKAPRLSTISPAMARSALSRATLRRLAEHVPQFPPGPGRGIYTGAARAHAGRRAVREVHGRLGRAGIHPPRC